MRLPYQDIWVTEGAGTAHTELACIHKVVSSKEKHIEKGLYPKMGVATATKLNATSQREDLAKRHNTCLPCCRM